MRSSYALQRCSPPAWATPHGFRAAPVGHYKRMPLLPATQSGGSLARNPDESSHPIGRPRPSWCRFSGGVLRHKGLTTSSPSYASGVNCKAPRVHRYLRRRGPGRGGRHGVWPSHRPVPRHPGGGGGIRRDRGPRDHGGRSAWHDRRSPYTATLVEKMIAAGMIVLGKTHTVQFAMGGWGTNQQFGTPWNPWDLAVHRTPGGSSAGFGGGGRGRPRALGDRHRECTATKRRWHHGFKRGHLSSALLGGRLPSFAYPRGPTRVKPCAAPLWLAR